MSKSKRSKFTDISNKTRKEVLERDKRCLICGREDYLTLAHIFLSRAKGGKGCKENLVTLCSGCHLYILDNPIGKTRNDLSKKYKERLKAYLIAKENIEYNEDFIKSIRYDKWKNVKKKV